MLIVVRQPLPLWHVGLGTFALLSSTRWGCASCFDKKTCDGESDNSSEWWKPKRLDRADLSWRAR